MSGKICPQCQVVLDHKRANQRFCSPRCKWTWTNRNRVVTPNVRFTCKVCNKLVERYVEPSKLRSGQATAEYCGRKCKGVALSGASHPGWNGGRIVEADGYVMIHSPDHPNANNKGYVFEHRLVMEAHIGRYLSREEVVHHVNGNRQDNRVENLQLFANNAEHKKAEAAEPGRLWHGGKKEGE